MTDLRCISKTCDDGPPVDEQPAPRLATEGFLCRRHADRFAQDIAELPARRDLLHNVLLHGTTAGARLGNSTTKGNPPLPSRGFDSTHDALADLEQKTVSWVQLVAEERREHGPDRQTIRALASYLVGRHDWIVRQPWVDDMAEEMRDLARVADGLTRPREQYHRKPTPCTRCGAQEMGRWDGEDGLTCGACGATCSDEHHQEIVVAVARASTAMLDRAEAAALLGVTRAHLRQIVHRKKLKVAGYIEGEERYEASVVQALRDQMDAREEQTA